MQATDPALTTAIEGKDSTAMAIEYENSTTTSVNRAAHVAACEAYADQVERLALSLNTRDPDVIAEALWAEDCPGQPADPDHLVHLACDFRTSWATTRRTSAPRFRRGIRICRLPPTRGYAIRRVLIHAKPNGS